MIGYRKINTDQVKIVLDDVALERFKRKSPISHSHDKGMVHKLLPDITNIWALKEPFDKVTTADRVSERSMRDTGIVNSRSKGQSIGRVEVVQRTVALAQSWCGANRCLDIPTC